MQRKDSIAMKKYTEPKRLDDKGRCCGIKPIKYKKPVLHYFCHRCDREYNEDGYQVPNWAWEIDRSFET